MSDAVARFVPPGASVCMGTALEAAIPFAAGHEIIRQRRRDLTLVRMTPDLIYDQMIGAGCARRLVFSWGGNPGVGPLYRLRDAITTGWPVPLEIQEHSHAELANRYVAGAAGLPFAVLRGSAGTDLPLHTPTVSAVRCPFTGEELTAVAAINPDVTIVHAQRADRAGNVQFWGISGVQKEAVLAARRALATVEEVVDELDPVPGGIVLPRWVLSHVAVARGGAVPSYAHGYYARDNAAYLAWEQTSRDREAFTAWLRELEKADPTDGEQP